MSRRRPQQYEASGFSIGEMLTPSQRAPPKSNPFSGIAHHHPPGGKSSIDFSFGAPPSQPVVQQQRSSGGNQWQTSSRAASAAVDLSYQLQLPQTAGRPPSAGRRAMGSPAAGPNDAYDSGYGGQQPMMSGQPGYPAYNQPPYPGQQYSAMSSRASSRGAAGAGADGGYWGSNNNGNYMGNAPSWGNSGPGSGRAANSGYPASSYTGYSPEMQREIAQQQMSQPQQPAYSSTPYQSYTAGNDGRSTEMGYGQPTEDWSSPGAGYGSQQSYTAQQMAPAAAARSPAAAAAHGRGGPGSLAGIPKPAGSPQFSESKGAFGGKVIVQPPGGRTTLNLFG